MASGHVNRKSTLKILPFMVFTAVNPRPGPWPGRRLFGLDRGVQYARHIGPTLADVEPGVQGRCTPEPLNVRFTRNATELLVVAK